MSLSMSFLGPIVVVGLPAYARTIVLARKPTWLDVLYLYMAKDLWKPPDTTSDRDVQLRRDVLL